MRSQILIINDGIHSIAKEINFGNLSENTLLFKNIPEEK